MVAAPLRSVYARGSASGRRVRDLAVKAALSGPSGPSLTPSQDARDGLLRGRRLTGREAGISPATHGRSGRHTGPSTPLPGDSPFLLAFTPGLLALWGPLPLWTPPPLSAFTPGAFQQVPYTPEPPRSSLPKDWRGTTLLPHLSFHYEVFPTRGPPPLETEVAMVTTDVE